MLLKHGAYIEAKDYVSTVPAPPFSPPFMIHLYNMMYGGTPLHNACDSGHVKVVGMLMKHDADANAEDNVSTVPAPFSPPFMIHLYNMMDNKTPLHYACDSGHDNVVEMLLKHGADANAKDKDNKTPLYYACRNCHDNVVGMLLKHGADANAKDNDNKTRLHYACDSGHDNLVEMLLKHGADANAKDKDGKAPLHYACGHGYVKVVEILLEHGADAKVKDNDLRTPLHAACNVFASRKVAQQLLRRGADPDARDFVSLSTTMAYFSALLLHLRLIRDGLLWQTGARPLDLYLRGDLIQLQLVADLLRATRNPCSYRSSNSNGLGRTTWISNRESHAAHYMDKRASAVMMAYLLLCKPLEELFADYLQDRDELITSEAIDPNSLTEEEQDELEADAMEDEDSIEPNTVGSVDDQHDDLRAAKRVAQEGTYELLFNIAPMQLEKQLRPGQVYRTIQAVTNQFVSEEWHKLMKLVDVEDQIQAKTVNGQTCVQQVVHKQVVIQSSRVRNASTQVQETVGTQTDLEVEACGDKDVDDELVDMLKATALTHLSKRCLRTNFVLVLARRCPAVLNATVPLRAGLDAEMTKKELVEPLTSLWLALVEVELSLFDNDKVHFVNVFLLCTAMSKGSGILQDIRQWTTTPAGLLYVFKLFLLRRGKNESWSVANELRPYMQPGRLVHFLSQRMSMARTASVAEGQAGVDVEVRADGDVTDETLRTIVCRGIELNVEELGAALEQMRKDMTETLDKHLLLDSRLRKDYEKEYERLRLKEDRTNRVKNWWVGHGSPAENALFDHIGQTLSLRQEFIQTEHGPSGELTFREDRVRVWLLYVCRFNELALTYTHIAGGLPPRASVYQGLSYKNGVGRQRAAFFAEKQLSILTRVSKTYWLSLNEQHTFRYMDQEISTLIFMYLLLCKPLEHMLSSWLQKRGGLDTPDDENGIHNAEQDDEDLLDDELDEDHMSHDETMTLRREVRDARNHYNNSHLLFNIAPLQTMVSPATIYATFHRQMTTYLHRPKLGVATWRHAATFWMTTFVINRLSAETTGALGSLIHTQAQHSGDTAQRAYARTASDHVQTKMSSRLMHQVASQKWHALFGLDRKRSMAELTASQEALEARYPISWNPVTDLSPEANGRIIMNTRAEHDVPYMTQLAKQATISWGHSFNSQEQLDLAAAIDQHRPEDGWLIVVAPTGMGKTFCTLPKLGCRPHAGTVLWIVPFVAVANDLLRRFKAQRVMRQANGERVHMMVFCDTVNEVKLLCDQLHARGYVALPYYTDLEEKAQKDHVAQWQRGECDVIVATSCLSTGVDLLTIRHVLWYGNGYNVYTLAQAFGRAGRDKQGGTAELWLPVRRGPAPGMEKFVEGNACRSWALGKLLDPRAATCFAAGQPLCDVCAGTAQRLEPAIAARQQRAAQALSVGHVEAEPEAMAEEEDVLSEPPAARLEEEESIGPGSTLDVTLASNVETAASSGPGAVAAQSSRSTPRAQDTAVVATNGGPMTDAAVPRIQTSDAWIDEADTASMSVPASPMVSDADDEAPLQQEAHGPEQTKLAEGESTPQPVMQSAAQPTPTKHTPTPSASIICVPVPSVSGSTSSPARSAASSASAKRAASSGTRTATVAATAITRSEAPVSAAATPPNRHNVAPIFRSKSGTKKKYLMNYAAADKFIGVLKLMDDYCMRCTIRQAKPVLKAEHQCVSNRGCKRCHFGGHETSECFVGFAYPKWTCCYACGMPKGIRGWDTRNHRCRQSQGLDSGLSCLLLYSDCHSGLRDLAKRMGYNLRERTLKDIKTRDLFVKWLYSSGPCPFPGDGHWRLVEFVFESARVLLPCAAEAQVGPLDSFR
ncbi:uncharacterized protein MONBRDRAFT_11038 [Monosiga brevicollis MX1]|uniref:Helicase C-terminal domain-containing protein n=1 Tax=Monosiga brevicollis TaxID=81824 RepID=A9V813_MONBE|nr:uncharacterized protein MONBRDRAFT_11038 [Monosiga brevicollis MX1]EDQ86259.1 predicted protein [Monosiga brevicollis MX1]|eukprot:XP_001748929.1 hypothetical protein [Monosiga brevicollis MX1]